MATAAAWAGYAAVAFTLTRINKLLTPKIDTPNRGLEIGISATDQEGYAIYGEVRVSGVNVIPPLTGGNSGRYLEQVLAHAIHEVDSYTNTYVDDTSITSAQITAVAGNANDGLVTATKYVNALWVRRYTGTASQTVDFILNDRYASHWPSTARGRGIAYSAMTYDWGEGKIYNGYPIITHIIRGARCYDPRLDSTNGGSGSHRLNDSTTWEYTNCPPLCLANYAMASYGGRVSSAVIDWPSVAAAANICDVLVDIPGAATQKRYTFNARFPVARDWRENAKLFIDAMLGRMTKRGDLWYIYAGAYDAPTFAVAKADWLSIDSIKAVAPRDGGRWNTVRCWYTDPSRNWQREECFPRRNATYKSADGAEEISFEIEQPACTSEYEAQRKAEFMLRQSRNQVALVGVLGPRFRKIATGEMGAFTFEDFGWASKLMRVRAMDLLPDGSVRVAIAEEQEADWADLEAADYNNESTSTIPDMNPTTPSEPGSLSVQNTINGTLLFTFTSPLVRPKDTRFQIIRSTNSANASIGTVVWDGDLTKVELAAPNSQHWYYARAYSNSYFSAYSPNTFGVFGMGRYSLQDISNIVPDPEIQRSSAIGSHWRTSFHAAPFNIFSLDLTGGINGGRIIINVVSADYTSASAKAMYSVAVNSPTWSHGMQFAIGARVRRTSALSWSGANTYTLSIFPVAWSGVGTPNLQELGGGGNCRIFPNSTAYLHWYDVASLTLNQWFDRQRNAVLETVSTSSGAWFADPSGFPYLLLGIAVPQVPDGRAGGIEIDFAGTFL